MKWPFASFLTMGFSGAPVETNSGVNDTPLPHKAAPVLAPGVVIVSPPFGLLPPPGLLPLELAAPPVLAFMPPVVLLAPLPVLPLPGLAPVAEHAAAYNAVSAKPKLVKTIVPRDK